GHVGKDRRLDTASAASGRRPRFGGNLYNLTQIVIYTLTVGSVLALVALGYSLVFATTRIVNFAHGSMLVVAGYLTFALVRAGLNVWLAFLVTVALSAGVGMIIEI